MKIKNIVISLLAYAVVAYSAVPALCGALDGQLFGGKIDSSEHSARMVSLSASEGPVLADPVIAATPPMGWNSWNKFAHKVTDADIRSQADAMVANGMRDAGYTYITIDDTWQGKRDADGVLHPNAKFPDMKALADYVHSKGLKFGIYSSPGKKTCAGYEGSYGHEEQDARMFAEWGVDFLKYDNCGFNSIPEYAVQIGAKLIHAQNGPLIKKLEAEQIAAYKKMSLALRATGRPIVYSISQYGLVNVEKWASSVGANMWRTTNDIKAFFWRIAQIGFAQNGLQGYSGPSHWNDPDMLEIGNGRLSREESRLHMTLWCLLSAPLIAGNDLTKMPPDVLKILTDPELLAIDQDPSGLQGSRLSKKGPVQIWTKTLSDGSMAVGLFNLGLFPHTVKLDFKLLALGDEMQLRDVWEKTDLGVHKGSFSAKLPKHGVILLKLRPADN